MAGLGVAGPALASDLPGAPAVPVPAPPTIPPPPAIPALPPEVVEPPVVVTEIDGATVDVSIDVLSPVEDEETGSDAVVSPSIEGDTTAQPAAGGTEANEAASGAIDEAANTTISVRVLSPGSNGSSRELAQEGEGDVDPAGADPEHPGPDAAPAATPTPDATQDSEQYQADNSQYQSGSITTAMPWNWTWTLTLDCAGNSTSRSIDTGDPESLEWSWQWSWEWGCAGSEPESGATANASTGDRSSTTGEPRAPPGGAQARSSSGPVTHPGEPWNWTWTFTFCGETTTFSTQAGTGTPLTWTWDWAWIWSCGSAPAAVENAALPSTLTPPAPVSATPPSAPAGPQASTSTGPSFEAPGPDEIQLPTVTLPAMTFTFDSGPASTTLELPPTPTVPVEIDVEVAIPPAIPPVPTDSLVPLAAVPFPPRAAPLEHGPSATWPPALRPSTSMRPLPTTHALQTGATSAGGQAASRTRPVKQSRPHVTRARPSSTPSIPSVPRPRHGAASSSASGAGSSALLIGIAALTGFVLLAAPGLGRRIQVARELSPRSLDRSPIDHPG